MRVIRSTGAAVAILSAGISAACLSACGDTCADNRNVLPKAGFYLSTELGMQKSDIDSLQIAGVGAPSDSVLSPARSVKDEVYLPFRIDSDTTSYIFTKVSTKGDKQDKITFVYSREPRFVSHECGVSYIFRIRSISWEGVLVDSVSCTRGYIDNHEAESLKIYFNTVAAPNYRVE